MAPIAINGLGRIGRAALKIALGIDGADAAAVNDLIPAGHIAYLLRYDTVCGRYGMPMAVRGDSLIMDGRPVRVLACRAAPEKLGVDLVLAYTGAFRREEDLRKHLAAGARFASLPAPARAETVATVVHGVNQAPAGQQMISCASCTTNRIAPVAEVMTRRIGVRQAIMTAVHAHTPSQQLIDGRPRTSGEAGPAPDGPGGTVGPRRARSRAHRAAEMTRRAVPGTWPRRCTC
jgi:glyceraldehyde 3-phosphate dehydrogenase